jgi:hypothetical protein
MYSKPDIGTTQLSASHLIHPIHMKMKNSHRVRSIEIGLKQHSRSTAINNRGNDAGHALVWYAVSRQRYRSGRQKG